MELPASLRASVDEIVAGVPIGALKQGFGRLSARYRAETIDGRMHLDAELAVKAYLATRLPATYAAVRASFESAGEVLPDFLPKSVLDIGAGPGTATWAAADCWPSIETSTLVEASAAAREAGERIAGSQKIETRWLQRDITSSLDGAGPADLVTMAYVLDELPETALQPLVSKLWALAVDCLIVVEPGTPAGWRRILAVREQLLASGAHIAAPCPHSAPCPINAPDWCHFSRKVARSRVHRLAKGAEVPWEDEKFIYVAATHAPVSASFSRALLPPRGASGQVRLKLCRPDGAAVEQLFTKRDGAAFRNARRVDWGDTLAE